MWILVLDRSGSMADPFSGAGIVPDRRTRRSTAESKWQAARETLVTEIGRLDPETRVALVVFNDRATLVAWGQAGSPETLTRPIAGIEPAGGTDLAAALRFATRTAEAGGSDDFARILIVSDGLSDPVEARLAAAECRDRRLSVDFVLIDPTAEGRELARRVAGATGGRWDVVASALELKNAIGSAGSAAAIEAERVGRLLAAADAEADELAAGISDRDQVLFTAAHPESLDAGSPSGPLWFYLHLASAATEVADLVAGHARRLGTLIRSSDAAGGGLQAGSLVEVRPVFRSISCVPQSQHVVWENQTLELGFQLTYLGAASDVTLAGRVDVFVDGLIIGEVPVIVRITPLIGASRSRVQKSAGMLRRVFASYAHEDEDIVRQCKAAYRALGITLFVDRDDLESGQPWRSTLRQMVGRHDLFQLYWSAASAASPQVAEEWTFALQHAGTRAVGTDFVRPLYWQRPMPQVPSALSELHFRYLDPGSLGPAVTGVDSALSPGAGAIEVDFPVRSLIPLPDPDDTFGELTAAMREIVPMVEGVTGLRFYPPPLLLVDDHLVTSVRSEVEADRQASRPPSPDAVDPQTIRDVLTSLSLCFHMGLFLPDGSWSGMRPDPVRVAAFEHVRFGSEIFGWMLERALAGQDPLSDSRLVASALDAGLPAGDFPDYAAAFVDHVGAFLADAISHAPGDPFHNGYLVGPQGLSWIRGHAPDGIVDWQEVNRSWDKEQPVGYTYTLTQAGMLRLWEIAGAAMMDCLANRPVFRPSLVRSEASTYGVFTRDHSSELDRLADAFQVPSFARPARGPKVLICADAFSRLRNSMIQEGARAEEAHRRSVQFLRVMLAHEQMHAAVALGIASDHHAARAFRDDDEWALGSALNESLAAWVGLHQARGDGELTAACWEYIRLGRYPAWPYAGAETLEDLYQSEGLAPIRTIIALLREDPLIAQRRFDDLANLVR